MAAQVYNQMVERLCYSPAPAPVKTSKRLSPPKSRVNSAKRNLFGAVQREEFNAFYDMQMKQENKQKMEKWNFDFQQGVAKDGPFRWELARATNIIPAAHSRRQASSKERGNCSSADLRSSTEPMHAPPGPADCGDSDSHDESLSPAHPAMTAQQEEREEPVRTNPTSSAQRSSSPKPSSSKDSKLTQSKITDFLKERKRRLTSATVVTVKKTSPKKRRLM